MSSLPQTLPQTLSLPDDSATAALGARLARILGPGDVVALHGDLGVGKTALARGLVRALLGDPEEEVPSPTFTLVQMYEAEAGTVWHFDLYRLDAPDEALELGIEDAFYDGISLVEWPDRLGGLLPADRLDVTLSLSEDGTGRVARLDGRGRWQTRELP